jgi:two-component system, OmpR family, sensor histidine kinase KdpD
MTLDRAQAARIATLLVVGIVSLGSATALVAILEGQLGVPNASAVYFVAVVATAVAAGTPGALLAGVAAFLLYDFLFVDPRHTFVVADPGEWLNLVLMLCVAVVVGQLAAVQRRAADEAHAREREALAQFRISRALATRDSTIGALGAVADLLHDEAGMTRVWIALGADGAQQQIGADTGDAPVPAAAMHAVLQRSPDDVPARWQRVHEAGKRRDAGGAGGDVFRVRIDAGGAPLGSIWGTRPRPAELPDRTQTRLLSAAADQIGQVLAHDRLAMDAQEAEIARQGDALKTALVQSVSHDLRTPLATIRAAAGTLRDPAVSLSLEDQRESAAAIDREVEYLDRLVTNLLDLSRIEAGALRADRDVFELDDLLEQTLDRLRPRLADRPLELDLVAPPVRVDAVFLDEAVTNALENAVRHTPRGTAIRIRARELDESYVRLTIEDAGPGVPDAALPRLFEKFYRVPGGLSSSRAGTGVGLAVAHGLVAAMGGRIQAGRGELGGLAIDIDLVIARIPDGIRVEGRA